MSKKKLLWIVVPILAVVGIGAAGAGYKHFRGHHNPDRIVERISDRLELTGDQRQKLDAVKDAFLQSRKDMLQQREDVINQVIEEIRKPEIDQAHVMELIEMRKARVDNVARQVLSPIIEFHKSLDDTQREKVINRLESIRDWGHGFGRGYGHGPRHG